MRDYRNSKHYYVMAKVLASMKQLSYNVQVALSVKSGFCCGCILSLSQSCMVAMKSCVFTIEQNTA